LFDVKDLYSECLKSNQKFNLALHGMCSLYFSVNQW